MDTRTAVYSSVILEAVPQFQEWLTERQYSAGLIETRGKHCRGFGEWVKERGVEQFRQLSRNIVEGYQRSLFQHRKANGKPLTAGTQFARLCSVKSLLKWATRAHLMDMNPAAELVMPRLPDRIPREILTPREMEAVFNVPDLTDVLGLRDRAILEVFYSTGIRRTELSKLQVHDVDATRGTLMVREGKGRRDRMVPLGERGLQWVQKYLDDSRPLLVMDPDAQVLFLSKTGEPFHPDALSWLARRYVDGAEIGKHGSCHLFRHSMATSMMENGADIRFIQALLGHRVMDTTAIYTRVAVGKLKEIHKATHPSENGKTDSPTEDGDDRAVERAALLEDLLNERKEEPDDDGA